MATKPSNFTDWAEDFRYDPSIGFANRILIPVQFRSSGLKKGQPYPAEFNNTQQWLVNQWIKFFEDQYQVDDIHYTVDATATATDIENQFGGTWAVLGTGSDTLAGQTVYLFIKVS